MKLDNLFEDNSYDINKIIKARYAPWAQTMRGRPPQANPAENRPTYLIRNFECKTCGDVIIAQDLPKHLRDHGFDIPFDDQIEGAKQKLDAAAAANRQSAYQKPDEEWFTCTQPRGTKAGIHKCGVEFQRYTCNKCHQTLPPVKVLNSFGDVTCPYCHGKRAHNIDIIDHPRVRMGVVDRKTIMKPDPNNPPPPPPEATPQLPQSYL